MRMLINFYSILLKQHQQRIHMQHQILSLAGLNLTVNTTNLNLCPQAVYRRNFA